MLNGLQVTALIPARGGSRRVPRKNMALLGGETLIARKVRQLSESSLVDRIIVGSEDPEILDEARRAGAETVVRARVDEGPDSANDMIREFCGLVRTDVVLWAHCTNPLVSGGTYDAALRCLGKDGTDSVVSVHRLREHLWMPDRRTPCYDVAYCRGTRHLCASEVPSYYMQDGAIFVQPLQQMRGNCYFFGERPYLFEVPESEFLDINTERDMQLARVLVV